MDKDSPADVEGEKEVDLDVEQSSSTKDGYLLLPTSLNYSISPSSATSGLLASTISVPRYAVVVGAVCSSVSLVSLAVVLWLSVRGGGAVGVLNPFGGVPGLPFRDVDRSLFVPSPNVSMAELYHFSAAPPPLLTLNRPYPPRFPFKVDVNTARLAAFYSLLRAGVGVVVGMVGGSVSSGHGTTANNHWEQAQLKSYGAQFVAWLNRHYPVRHNDTYRYLDKHVLWNLARPGTDCKWSSFCLESQFMEVRGTEEFASRGNVEWIMERQAAKEVEQGAGVG